MGLCFGSPRASRGYSLIAQLPRSRHRYHSDYRGTDAPGSLLITVNRLDLTVLSIGGSGGNDTLIIDLINGNPLRDGILDFKGSVGTDSHVLKGKTDLL